MKPITLALAVTLIATNANARDIMAAIECSMHMHVMLAMEHRGAGREVGVQAYEDVKSRVNTCLATGLLTQAEADNITRQVVFTDQE